MNEYVRRLDKVYAYADASPMLPRVVKKMKTEYADNPHDFYLLVCHKWGVTPEEKFDGGLLVHGSSPRKQKKAVFPDETEKLKEDATEVTEVKIEADEKPVENDSKVEEPEVDVNEEINTDSRLAVKPVQEQIEYVTAHVGDIVETMVLTEETDDQETGFWIGARIMSIDMKKEIMNLKVIEPQKYGLPQIAMNVPYRYVRIPSEVVMYR